MCVCLIIPRPEGREKRREREVRGKRRLRAGIKVVRGKERKGVRPK